MGRQKRRGEGEEREREREEIKGKERRERDGRKKMNYSTRIKSSEVKGKILGK